MAISTLGRDYDIGRILEDHRIRIEALERRVNTLNATLKPYRVVQSAGQSVASSVALVNTGIVINVDGLLKVDLEFRWMSGGGGIRWDWNTTGTVTLHSRFVGAAGNPTGGNPGALTEMRWANTNTLAADVTVPHFSTSGVQRGSERLVVSGSGTMTLRFAQETSNVAATNFDAGVSHAVVTRLAA